MEHIWRGIPKKNKPWYRNCQWHEYAYNKAKGIEEVFKFQCWHGPKSYGDLMPDFTDFAGRHGLLTQTPGTARFNKTVCGCRAVDDCYEPKQRSVPWLSL
mmetsp:Transcript_31776/g.68378  ORF Transcript_31776/g.68378 Transcript_31776/m.68378 type:complete len:100 (+) Transcript_31776:462-761(+)